MSACRITQLAANRRASAEYALISSPPNREFVACDYAARPPETNLIWSGEINELKEATDRLKVILPITLLVIGFLVYSAVRNWLATIIVLIEIPVACTGGILAPLIAREEHRRAKLVASSSS